MSDNQTRFDKETKDVRMKRELKERDSEARPKTWVPPTVLPVPDPQDGYAFRWVRTSMRGEQDNTNVSRKFREGWEPVRLEDHPELKILPDIDTRFDGHAVIGGLMLCKIPEETIAMKRAYLKDVADSQMEAVDNSYLREEDSRMPLLPSERSTRVTFGDGS